MTDAHCREVIERMRWGVAIRSSSIAACIDDGLVAFPDKVAEGVLAEVLPDVFDRVQFGGVRRQRQQGNVVRDHKGAAGFVPTGTVENEDGVGARSDLAADFGQVQGLGRDVDRRQDQRNGSLAVPEDATRVQPKRSSDETHWRGC